MNPHEEWLRNQGRLDAAQPIARLRAAYAKVRQHVPERHGGTLQPDHEPLKSVAKQRSSRLAAFVRSHKKSFIGGALAAFTLGIAGEVVRRLRGKR